MKKYLNNLLHKTGVAFTVDKLRYYFYYLKNYRTNKKIITQYPDFVFPPPYFLYETYMLNYEAYYKDGFETAKEIIEAVDPYINFKTGKKKLLDWGCGPARVVRQLPVLLHREHSVYGCDYNDNYVKWCSNNIREVSFIKNELSPPVPLPNDFFDCIYGLSIITHLSEQKHFEWIKELYRLLKPGGILLITSHGKKFVAKLMPDELRKFNSGKLVTRSAQNEGHRVYTAFQPKQFMELLFKDFKILQVIPGGSENSIHGEQDTWIVQKTIALIA